MDSQLTSEASSHEAQATSSTLNSDSNDIDDVAVVSSDDAKPDVVVISSDSTCMSDSSTSNDTQCLGSSQTQTIYTEELLLSQPSTSRNKSEGSDSSTSNEAMVDLNVCQKIFDTQCLGSSQTQTIYTEELLLSQPSTSRISQPEGSSTDDDDDPTPKKRRLSPTYDDDDEQIPKKRDLSPSDNDEDEPPRKRQLYFEEF